MPRSSVLAALTALARETERRGVDNSRLFTVYFSLFPICHIVAGQAATDSIPGRFIRVLPEQTVNAR
jgi:hypothetical protein